MKNIAILIRGHCRNYKKLLNNFKNNFLKDLPSDYKIYIFVHTWTKNNYKNRIKTNKEQIITDYNLNENNIIIENQDEILNNKLFLNNSNRDKFKFQLYGIYKLKELLLKYENTNNIKFDYVFFTRFDLIYYISLKDLLTKIDNKITLFPKDVYYDIYCLLDRKYLEIYGNMILYNFKKIKKIYNSYGINPIIKFIRQKFNLNVNYIKLAYIRR